MERIATEVAVETILYACPQKEVEIYDYSYFAMSVGDPITSVQGKIYKVRDILSDYRCTKIAKAAVRRLDIKDGHLFIMIDSAHEQY